MLSKQEELERLKKLQKMLLVPSSCISIYNHVSKETIKPSWRETGALQQMVEYEIQLLEEEIESESENEEQR